MVKKLVLTFILIIFTTLLIISCESATQSKNTPVNRDQIIPLNESNVWIYRDTESKEKDTLKVVDTFMHNESKVYVFNKTDYTRYKQLFYRKDTLFYLSENDEEYFVAGPSNTSYNPNGEMFKRKIVVPAGSFKVILSKASLTNGIQTNTSNVFISPGVGPIKYNYTIYHPKYTFEHFMELIHYDIE